MRGSRTSLAVGIILALLGVNIIVWAFLYVRTNDTLIVSFLDVGQGDAILIQTPTGTDVLIDGGRDRSVLRELTKQLGPLDRSIDLVIATHPDADHIGGLPGVFERYQVKTFMEPAIESDTVPSSALASHIQEEPDLTRITARRGMRLDLGAGAYADILFPDRDVPTLESNTGSIVMQLRYGATSFLLTGDAPSAIEEWLVSLDGEKLTSNVLKAGHHGSRTSTAQTFLDTVNPETVVISAGKDNSYGHPHEEVTTRIQASGASIVGTMGNGAVTFVSDGTHIWRR